MEERVNVAPHPQHTGLDVISLCTGGGGLDLGLELALPGARAVCMVEREAFAVAHLVSAMEQGLLAPCPVWSDARTFDGRPWRGLVDGLIGGIPCQPHSLAGRKRGSIDERDLWSPTRRIIAQARPWFVLIENVAGMLSPGDDDVAGAQRVWRDLRRLGFAVEGGLFRASEIGAPHERERLFILGVLDDAEGWRERRVAGGAGSAAAPDASGNAHGAYGDAYDPGKAMADAGGARLQRGELGRASGSLDGQHAPRPATEFRGASVVDAALLGRGEGRPEPSLRSGRDTIAGTSLTLADADLAQLRREPPAGELAQLQQDDRLGPFPPGPADIDGWRRVLAHSPDLEPAVRRMADGVAARLDLSGPHAARIERLRMLGNGVVPLQAAYAIRTLAARLAARGSAGAARLVRLMG